jgi:hypothetical protein
MKRYVELLAALSTTILVLSFGVANAGPPPQPHINHLSHTSGIPGLVVGVHGTALASGKVVVTKDGGGAPFSARIINANDTKITMEIPRHMGYGPIKIQVNNGRSGSEYRVSNEVLFTITVPVGGTVKPGTPSPAAPGAGYLPKTKPLPPTK